MTSGTRRVRQQALTARTESAPSDASTPLDEEQGKERDLREVMHILGISVMPDYKTLTVKIDSLLIPNESNAAIRRDANRLAESIRVVGVLQPPIVVQVAGESPDDPQASFLVVVGRRRCLGARIARDSYAASSYIECKLYDASCFNGRLRALFAAIENMQRRYEWRKEVADLALLVDDRVPLTEEQLVKMGFPPYALTERIKMARLPNVLRTLIVEGTMNQAVARQVIRLSREQQGSLCRMVSEEGEVSADVVKEMLQQEIGSQQRGLFVENAEDGNKEGVLSGVPATDAAIQSLPGLFEALLTFERMLSGTRETARAMLLSRTLRLEIEQLLRQHQETVAPVNRPTESAS